MVRTWLDGFLERLSESYPPQNWPKVGTEEWVVYFEDWVSALARNQVSEREAEAARSLLAEAPPRFKQEYIPAVIAAVKSLRPAKAGGPNLDDRESAKSASKECPHCLGEGLTIIYHPRPIAAAVMRIPAAVSAYCVCPMGRWVEGRHVETCPDVRMRTPHLSDVLNGRSVWKLTPPEPIASTDLVVGVFSQPRTEVTSK